MAAVTVGTNIWYHIVCCDEDIIPYLILFTGEEKSQFLKRFHPNVMKLPERKEKSQNIYIFNTFHHNTIIIDYTCVTT